MKSNVTMLADIIEKFIETSYRIDENAFSLCLLGYVWVDWLRFTNVGLNKIQDPKFFLFFENAIRGGLSGSRGPRHVVSEGDKLIINRDTSNFFCLGMSHGLPWASIKIDYTVSPEEILTTKNNVETGHALEVDLDYTEVAKSFHLPFCPGVQKISVS